MLVLREEQLHALRVPFVEVLGERIAEFLSASFEEAAATPRPRLELGGQCCLQLDHGGLGTGEHALHERIMRMLDDVIVLAFVGAHEQVLYAQ